MGSGYTMSRIDDSSRNYMYLRYKNAWSNTYGELYKNSNPNAVMAHACWRKMLMLTAILPDDAHEVEQTEMNERKYKEVMMIS